MSISVLGKSAHPPQRPPLSGTLTTSVASVSLGGIARVRCCVVALAAIIACGTLFVNGPGTVAGSVEAAALPNHGQIRIEMNSAFTSANGVVGGTGNAADTYVIGGWEINASKTDGILISNTTAFVVIRDVSVHARGNHTYSVNGYANHDGILIWNVQIVRIENATLFDNGNGIFLQDP